MLYAENAFNHLCGRRVKAIIRIRMLDHHVYYELSSADLFHLKMKRVSSFMESFVIFCNASAQMLLFL